MLKKIKLLTIVGTRPEIIRLSRIIPELDNNFDHTLVHTNQNYDKNLNDIIFKQLNLRTPDFSLNVAKKNAADTIAQIISSTNSIISKIKPEAFLVLGDTNSCLSVIAAKKNKIPIFHIEAGNRCFDYRVPEEINRKLIDHISDINLTYSNISREYLIKENFPQDQIIKIGSPMKEVYNYYYKKIKSSQILKKHKLIKNKYFLVSFHREENLENNKHLNVFKEIITEISNIKGFKVLISTHPRTKKTISNKNFVFSKNVLFKDPFGFLDYANLLLNSFVSISDSGTINEEASILNINAINLREVNERPEAMEMGSTIMTGLNLNNVMNAINHFSNKKNEYKKMVMDYENNYVSKIVTKTILSYTDFVNRRVWKKY